MKVEENFFKIIGLDEISSNILNTIISNPNIKIEQLKKILNVQIKELNSRINKLIIKDVLEITPENTIRFTSHFTLKTIKELEEKTSRFINKLNEAKFLIVEELTKEIQMSFTNEGYKILNIVKTSPRIRNRRFDIDFSRFFVEKFYKFGITIFDSKFNQNLKKSNLTFPPEYLKMAISEEAYYSNCIGAFIFFDPALLKNDVKKIMNYLVEEAFSIRLSKIPESDILFFIQSQEISIQKFIEDTVKEIEIRRDTVEQRFKEIQESLKSTKDLIVEDSMMVSQLNSLALGQYLPELHKSKSLIEFMKPVKNVTDRESRNLEIFERKFEEEKALVERAIDNFDKRISLPNSAKLTEELNKINKLHTKFEPIKHELRFLLQILLSPYIRGNTPKIINPFILTEPNDIETFTINQGVIKDTALKFIKSLNAKSTNILFITGEAGMGKSHILRHIFTDILKKEQIWTIYLDCPMKYDIVSSLFNEIVQDRNFPKEVVDFLPSLRKEKISNELEFTEMIKKLHDLIVSSGYKGLVLLIDEFENSLPYTYDIYYKDKKLTGQSIFKTAPATPIALKQLKGILTSDFASDTGFVISFRNHILNEFENSMDIKNFDKFLISPEKLKLEDFNELIKLRYKTWHCKNIKINETILKKILNLTDYNVRHTIQYLRALYQFSFDSGDETINLKTLKDIGEIPLFSY